MATPLADMEFDSPSKEKEDKEDEPLHSDGNANAGQEKVAEVEHVQKKLSDLVLAGDEPDSSLSVKPELRLANISMKDLTVDAQGKESAFHDKKAREHEECHLGGGSFGEVFKATHTDHGVVAVKLAKPGKEDRIKMCKKEIEKHVISLISENVVAIKGFVECEDKDCNCGLIGIVMNFMEQGSLWDFRIKKWTDAPELWPHTNRMVYEISLGMQFLHSKDIIHRDLKLENVLVDVNLRAKIADLGLATNLQTSFGDKCWGTYSHQPPEAFRIDLPDATKVVTQEYDVYSFAMTLYELLTGIHPYSDRGFDMIRLLKVEAKQTPSLQPIPKNATAGLIEVMEKSWRYEPHRRPDFTEITDLVGNLDINPSYESKGYYFGKPCLAGEYNPVRGSGDKKPERVDNPHPLKWIRDYLHYSPQFVHHNGATSLLSSIVCGVPQVNQSQPRSSERDPTIIFDSPPPSDQDFEIKLQVKLTVPIGASIASKVDQILSSLGRCKHRAYWPTNNSSLCNMFLSHKVTLQTLQLPPTVGGDQFTIFLRVSNKSALENLHSLSKTGLLQSLLVQSFVDSHLEDLCRPVKPDLKVDKWEEQFNKGMEHFQKKEKADDSNQSETDHSEFRSERHEMLTKLGSKSTEKVNQDTLLEVVKLIPGDTVKSLGRHLELEDIKVKNTVYRNRFENSSEIAYQVLLQWKQFKGKEATKGFLANALWNAECYDAARNVR